MPNTHEAIIEQELFDAVQAILKAKHEEYHSRLGKYAHFDIENIFEGLVACACCQHNMTRYKSVYNKGRTVAYHFICPRHAMLLDAGCPNAGGLRESDLEAAVYEVLRLQMAMLTDAEAVIQRVSRSSAARSRRTALDDEIVSVQGRLKKLATLRQTLFESYVDGIVTQADYLSGKAGMRMKPASLRDAFGICRLKRTPCRRQAPNKINGFPLLPSSGMKKSRPVRCYWRWWRRSM